MSQATEMAAASTYWVGFLERMSVVDSGEYPDHVTWLWAAALIIGGGMCLFTPIYRRTEIVSTLAHELGHGLGGVLAGRKFTSFALHPDASGVTHTTGAGRIGLIFCFWSGYAAPGTTAALLAGLLAYGAPSWIYLIIAVLMLTCLIRARSLTTIAVILGTGAACFALWWLNVPQLQSAIAVFMIGYFLVTGTRQINDAWRQRKTDGGEADGDALASLTFIPEIVWLVLFYVYTAVCAALSVALLAWVLTP